MKAVVKYMDPSLVSFLNVTSRDEALKALVDQINQAHPLPDVNKFYQAICDREKLVSTGIGMGVALPHAKVAELDQFFIAIGILQKGVDWNSLDKAPVRIIFLIGGPDDKQTEYLQLLSGLTLFIKNEDIRKKLLTLNSKEAILQLFSHGSNP